MEESSAIAIASVIMPLVVQCLKKSWPEVNPRIWAISLSALAGLVYALTVTYAPRELLEEVAMVGGLAFAFGTALYKLQK